MKTLLVPLVLLGLFSSISAVPPNQNQGWGQMPQQQQQGWGQMQQQDQNQGWGQQMAQMQQQGWGQDSNQGDQSGQKGKGGINWDVNFALGYQGEKGQQQQGQQQGWGQPMMQMQQQNQGGWSSEPETNIMKPDFMAIFKKIMMIPKEIKDLFKESGLWILFLPLLVIIPLFLLAFSAGKFFGGLDEGWGWERSGGKPWIQEEWDNLVGFIKDPKVQRAAKGFMDEFVAKRIMTSVKETGTSAEKKVGVKKSVKVTKSR